MAAASESNDASDIFWPGYVDAVTNLAINLLFVIAVMSIVVISTIMQISKMRPELVKPEDNAVVSAPRSTTVDDKKGNPQTPPVEQASKPPASQSQVQSQAQNQNQSIEKMVIENTIAQQKIVEQSKQLTKLQKEIEALKQGQAKDKNQPGKNEDIGGTGEINTPSDVVKATENRQKSKTGQNQFMQLPSGGVIVVFDSDVLRLSDAESAEFITKLSAQANIATNAFEIKVNTPKGFSESARLAYYRVNEIRNVLIKNGAKPASITMRVVESESQAANNARVLVRAAQP
jgi:TolA-binding protein